MDKKRALLVLGMHRSGTSATTRVLSWLGASLPCDMLPPAADNPTGFWESDTVVRINDAILATYGVTWDVAFRPPVGFAGSPEMGALRAQASSYLRTEFAASKLFVLKDPRMCQLTPFWLKALDDIGARVGVVITLRSPESVTRSLNRRHPMPRAQAAGLYLSHLLQAEKDTRGLDRCFLGFDAMLANPLAQARRIAKELRISLPSAESNWQDGLRKFVDTGLINHPDRRVFVPSIFRIQRRAEALYSQLNGLPSGDCPKSTTAFLDRLSETPGIFGGRPPVRRTSPLGKASAPLWGEARNSSNSTA